MAGALLEHLHAEANERGDAIAVLFPFRQGFYARHGYAPATATRRLVLSPHAVPRAWRSDGVRAAAYFADVLPDVGLIVCWPYSFNFNIFFRIELRQHSINAYNI